MSSTKYVTDYEFDRLHDKLLATRLWEGAIGDSLEFSMFI